MQLRDYLNQSNISPINFAGLVGVGHQNVYRYLSGKRIPSPEIMRRIVVATDGQVTPNDFYDLPEGMVGIEVEEAAA